MTSILTNNSAMVALSTLRSINMSLEGTQSQISTGKQIASAKDNSAIWAISKVMESDVKGFEAISESLNLGDSTITVARNAAETTTDLLTEIKEKIVGAQEENVDRAKLQTDIDALVGQVNSVIGAAQFNGLNLTKGTQDVNILSSLDRGTDGTVTSSSIALSRQDLSTDAGVYGTGTTLDANITYTAGANQAADGTGANTSAGGNVMTLTASTNAAGPGEVYNLQVAGTTVSFTTVAGSLAPDDVTEGLTAAINAAQIEGVTAVNAAGVISLTNTRSFEDVEVNVSGPTTQFVLAAGDSAGGTINSGAASTTASLNVDSRASDITFSASAAVLEGDGYRVNIGGTNYDYVAGKNETMEDVARGLKTVIDGAAVADVETNVTQKNGAWTLEVDYSGTGAITVTDTGTGGGTATGGLVGLDKIDVTTENGVAAALTNIETMIDTAIDAAAEFGSAQGRIETQSEFISSITDSFKSGIGALVDADMTEQSARLQALQVQQQLATQALSIANQAPQGILSLFR